MLGPVRDFAIFRPISLLVFCTRENKFFIGSKSAGSNQSYRVSEVSEQIVTILISGHIDRRTLYSTSYRRKSR